MYAFPLLLRSIFILVVSCATAASLHVFPHSGRGLKAAMELQKGDSILSVPKGSLLCNNFAERHFGGAAATLEHGEALAAVLAVEKVNPVSRWAPYIDMLPEETMSSLAVEEEDYAVLEGTCGRKLLSDSCVRHQQRAKDVCAFIAEHGPMHIRKHILQDDIRLCKWAVGIAFSRSHMLSVDGKKQACMVPYLDMVNHQFQGSLSADEDEHEVSLQANMSYAVGAQLWLRYGLKHSEGAYSMYSFVSPDMAPSCLALTFLQQYQTKLQHADDDEVAFIQLAVSHNCFSLDTHAAGGGVEWRLLTRLIQCARLMLLGKGELATLASSLDVTSFDKLRDVLKDPASSVPFLSVSNEFAALSWVNTTVGDILSNLTNTQTSADTVANAHNSKGGDFFLEYRKIESRMFQNTSLNSSGALMG